MPVCLQDSIDCLMNAAIAAGDDNPVCAVANNLASQFLDVAASLAFNYLVVDLVGE
jgi:hypothetical protein